jgi:hypothetical protein
MPYIRRVRIGEPPPYIRRVRNGEFLWYIRRVRDHAQSLLDALARVAGSGDLGPNVVAMSDALAGLRRERDRQSVSLPGELRMIVGSVAEQAFDAADDILDWLGLPREASWPDALDDVVVRGPSGATVLDSVIQRLRADVDKLGAYLAEWAWLTDPIPEAQLAEPAPAETGKKPRKGPKRTRKREASQLTDKQQEAWTTHQRVGSYAETARVMGIPPQVARKHVIAARAKIAASPSLGTSVRPDQQLPTEELGIRRPVGRRGKRADDSAD